MSSSYVRAFGLTRVLLGVNAGNAIEFYDWMAYALLVPYFGRQFFPNQSPAAVLLSSFAVFAVGSLARPIGAIPDHLVERKSDHPTPTEGIERR